MTHKNKIYLMWFILAFAYIIAQFHRVNFAVIVDYVIIDFGIEKAWVTGFLGGMYGITYLIMQIPSGLLADSWGPRKTVFTGMITAGIGTILFIATDIIFFAFMGRLLIGFGVAIVLVPIMKFQSNWFEPTQFATLTGLVILLGNIGKLFGTSPLAYFVTVFGWRSIFLVVGIITIFIALLTWIMVKDNPLEDKGKKNPNEKKFDYVDDINIKKNIIKSLKNQHLWFLLLIGFGMAGPHLAFAGTWSINYLMHMYDLTRLQASHYLMVMTIGTGIGACFIGYLSDYLKIRKKPLAFLLLSNILAWTVVVVWYGGHPPSLLLYFLFFIIGFCLSGVSLILSLAKEKSPPEYSGTSIGIVNMGPFAGMALFQPFQGWLLGLHWTGLTDEMGNKIYPLESFQLVFLTCILMSIISLYCVFKIQEEIKSTDKSYKIQLNRGQ
ncbi:MFS transporter [Natranaerofaba carboxydovora]|uniref:MFS transporter n=1 Tax=Natranaerofaba carboxydovora TaxID=2742683 RepID=UPI001F13418D|nr:MFS transporter [Natranaerofaba carboxydovora]UMZ74309.1 D-galactonate transporter [Natranaerofaba carboxydovora]